jgi:hypothetical protein
MILDSAKLEDNQAQDSLHIYTTIMEVAFHAISLARTVAYIGSVVKPKSRIFFENRMKKIARFARNFREDEKIAIEITLFRLRGIEKERKVYYHHNHNHLT